MISTYTPLKALEAVSALTRPHTSVRSGVVSADEFAQYQGTGMPFAGSVDVDGLTIAPRVRKSVPSGTTTWSPPV